VARLALAVMLFAMVGCANDSAFTTPHPATGDFAGPVDIGEGRHLYLECHGKGGPIIVLESGYHDSSDPWNLTDAAAPAVGPAVMSALARAHRVCAYDRPGTLRYTEPPSVTERSSPVSMPRTAQDVVGDLHALLTAADVPRDPTFLSRTPLVACSAGSTPRPIPIRCARCCSSTRSPSRYPR
jgi:hypothetical protein